MHATCKECDPATCTAFRAYPRFGSFLGGPIPTTSSARRGQPESADREFQLLFFGIVRSSTFNSVIRFERRFALPSASGRFLIPTVLIPTTPGTSRDPRVI
jgi:hypothetical protein